jgi:hypothetical protein
MFGLIWEMRMRETLRNLLMTPEPAALGPGPREGVQPEAALRREVQNALAESPLASERQQLVTALVLLWHDHLEPAHLIAQDITGPDGSFVHAIMHRREPDYGNAKYWFARVGEHPAMPVIAERVKTLPVAQPLSGLHSKLVRNGNWDAFAFVDLCEEAARKPGVSSKALVEIQKIETEVLLEYFCAVSN